MKYIVQKFGGTSLGKADRMRSVAEIVKDSIKSDRVVLALSAMSSYVKSEGTTSKLIEASDAALGKKDFYKIIDSIEEHHLSTISELMTGEIREQVSEEIKEQLRNLKSFLGAISVIGEMSRGRRTSSSAWARSSRPVSLQACSTAWASTPNSWTSP